MDIGISNAAVSGAIVNADIASGAAIAYSKLALTGGILNADVNAAAAIAYSKLNLSGSIVSADITDGTIVNADINASAAIASTKLAVPYTAYTPTWTATSGTAPAIGNATVTARYAQIGKMVHAYGSIIFGTTSTYGDAGRWHFALPAAALTTSGLLGASTLFDSSTGNAAFVNAQIDSAATTLAFEYPATYLGAFTPVAYNAPWTWATSDQVTWNFTYEAA